MTNNILTQLKQLYQEAFPEDSDAFRDYFFETFDTRDCYPLIEYGRVNAMAYVVRKPCILGKKQVNLPFIVALATRDSVKRRGKASMLMEEILSDLQDKGELFVALYPAVGHDFYAKFGFETISFMQEKHVTRNARNTVKVEVIKVADFERLDKINKKFFSKFDNFFIYNETVIKRLFAEYSAEDINLCIVIRDSNDMAYCFVDDKEKELNHVIGCYDSVDSVKEWTGYKYLVTSDDAGEHCQFKAICANEKDIKQLRKAKNFFIDKY